MNEDYLWNKTGSDPGIEELEKTLAVFRFQASEPPALPVKVVTLPERRSYNFLKLGFAFACVSSIVVALLLFLFQSAFYRSADNSTRVEAPVSNAFDSPSVVSGPVIPGSPSIRKPFVRPMQPAKISARPMRVAARRPKNIARPEKLTPEEKYAYNQLMLALSITSNELKIVKDKINGREERSAADDRQK